jgi:hypothetical protein
VYAQQFAEAPPTTYMMTLASQLQQRQPKVQKRKRRENTELITVFISSTFIVDPLLLGVAIAVQITLTTSP